MSLFNRCHLSPMPPDQPLREPQRILWVIRGQEGGAKKMRAKKGPPNFWLCQTAATCRLRPRINRPQAPTDSPGHKVKPIPAQPLRQRAAAASWRSI